MGLSISDRRDQKDNGTDGETKAGEGKGSVKAMQWSEVGVGSVS